MHAMNEGPSSLPQGPNPTNNNVMYQPQYQQLYGPSPNTYPSQLEMAHAQGSSRQGPYSMSAMANALPQPRYQPNYNSGQQPQRFSNAPSSNMMPTIAQMAQFQLGAQPYYVAQHPQISPYYNTHLSHTQQQQHQAQQQSNMSPRHSVNYYSSPVMMNQPGLTGYYYPPSNQYQSPHSTIQGQMAPGQYLMPDGASSDTRGSSSSLGTHDHGGRVTNSSQSDSRAI